ncbi:hypothetical protein DPQ33_04235 [Oceanidesulfovibrio indonesiensis]|uniref:ParB/Sulfiredoxin domain-containing protein n=1 Tax=Oceanidesulfovibrio indonesiensis TaxID=54767 RepID=A0A7M3MH12_9BACT|nr:hypothetical protein [Oceanidesulfovibrio indonesiensis]TVM18692.1 hypothetical protein DPQ33_04235 [Oceanidesulfovibrio indonesiensis]
MSKTDTVWLDLDDILVEDQFQIRAKMSGEAIQRYACAYRNEQDMPPLKVARVVTQETGDGEACPPVLLLVDGFHRYAALRQIGAAGVEAVVVDATWTDAQWLAAQANLTHGIPLKSKELRKAFRMYIKARKHREGQKGFIKSYREIAAELGGLRSHVTIRNWMMKDFPKIARAMTDQDFPNEGPGKPKYDAITPGQIAADHIIQARNAARGVTDPEERWELVRQLKEIVEELEDRGTRETAF